VPRQRRGTRGPCGSGPISLACESQSRGGPIRPMGRGGDLASVEEREDRREALRRDLVQLHLFCNCFSKRHPPKGLNFLTVKTERTMPSQVDYSPRPVMA